MAWSTFPPDLVSSSMACCLENPLVVMVLMSFSGKGEDAEADAPVEEPEVPAWLRETAASPARKSKGQHTCI